MLNNFQTTIGWLRLNGFRWSQATWLCGNPLICYWRILNPQLRLLRITNPSVGIYFEYEVELNLKQ